MRLPRHSALRVLFAAALVAVSLFAAACSTIETPTESADAATEAAPEPEPSPESDGEAAADVDLGAEASPEPAIEDEVRSEDEDDSEPALVNEDPQTGASGVIALDSTTCAFDQLVPLSVEPECYELTVPEDWDAPDLSDVVTIALAVFPSTSNSPADAPIMYLEGGPGGHSLEGVSFNFTSLVEPHLADHSFIVFDQRGAGLSEPSLACPEANEATLNAARVADAPDVEEQVALEAIEACRDRLLAEGVDLTEYHSINSSHDIEAMRTELGYEELNLLGISYGTRLAQTMIRLYPESVRSVVYDSVVPTEAELFSALSANAERSLKQLFAECEGDTECAAAYPDLEARFFAVIDELDAEPATLNVLNPLTANTDTFIATGVDALGFTFSALYSQLAFAAIPQFVADAEQGDYPVLEALAAQSLIQNDFLSFGMLLSVECHEELPFDEREALDAYTHSDLYEPVGEYLGGGSLFDACDVWPSGEAAPIEDELVTSDIPGLLLGGEYDPITPPSGLADIAAGLTTSWSYVFPHEGHAVAPTECGAEIIATFFQTPTSAPDASCIDQSPAPAFTPGGVGEIELVPFESSVLGSTVSGLRPAGWSDQGFGIFARGETVVDPTLLLTQGTFGTPASLLQGLLAESFGDLLGEDVTFDFGDDLTAGGSVWETLVAETEDQTIFLAINDEVLVGLAARPAELDALTERVLLPALEAVTTS